MNKPVAFHWSARATRPDVRIVPVQSGKTLAPASLPAVDRHAIEAWCRAAQAFAQSKQRADEAAAALEAARAQLITLAQHPREQGAGVTVTRYWKQGSVDYKKVPQLHGVELSLYRSTSRQEVRVSMD